MAHHDPAETVEELVSRLQERSRTNSTIDVHFTTNIHAEPAIVSQRTLSSLSPWFKNVIEADDPLACCDDIRFGDATAMTVKLFLYFLAYEKIPEMHKLEFMQDVEEYRKLLVRVWIFAYDHQVLSMQNAAMRVLLTSLRGEQRPTRYLAHIRQEEPQVETPKKQLSLELLQFALPKTTRGSLLRKALLHEALYLDGMEEAKLLDRVVRTFVDGYHDDLKAATAELKGRDWKRMDVEVYLVEPTRRDLGSGATS